MGALFTVVYDYRVLPSQPYPGSEDKRYWMRRDTQIEVQEVLDYDLRSPRLKVPTEVPYGWETYWRLWEGYGHSWRFVLGLNCAVLVLFDLQNALQVKDITGTHYVAPARVEFYDNIEHARFVLEMRKANNEF